MGSVQEFFEGLADRVSPDRIAGDEQHLRVRHRGRRSLDGRDRGRRDHRHRGRGRRRLTFAASEESFEKIVAGEQNPTTAYMTGKLKIKGDMGAAMKLQKMF